MNAAHFLLFAALGLCAGTAQAHHSLGMFDTSKELTLEGTVSRYEWTNPHAEVYLMVADDQGRTFEWKVEGGALGMMIRGGWRANSLASGDKIKVVVHPPRNGAQNLGQVVSATLADGRVLTAIAR